MARRRTRPQQELRFVPFDAATRLSSLLELQRPAFSRVEPFRQLDYIEEYVRNLGCRSLLIEEHYVDRDYIEDHSLFYSRSFFDYPNACRRLHFFSAAIDDVRTSLKELEDLCGSVDPPARPPRWAEFSRDTYIGFVAIKPLEGSPVGRTVLRCLAPATEDGSGDNRNYSGTRRYPVHLGAVELDVTGLPFQQQDVGVSACATTALWAALHKLRDFEEIGSPTPAQITTLATQYSLPFGRPMPSDEGLSLDQMCQALQALKVAPSLLSADSLPLAVAYIYSALRSGFAPVLILQDEQDEYTWHAVTAVGFRQSRSPAPMPGEAYDLSGDVRALYVHDDRIGPYQRVDPFPHSGTLGLKSHYAADDVTWVVRYVLVPLHAKIRVSVSGLRELAVESLDHIRQTYGTAAADTSLAVAFETWISRPIRYLQGLYTAGDGGPELARSLFARLAMPRYLGIVRLTGPAIGTIDVLIDTTSTMKNLNFLAVAHHGSACDERVLKALSSAYGCELFAPSLAAGV
jgi:hypothetical protein